MPLLGISIKLWSSDYDPSNNEFLTSDSVVYVFQDRSQEDILYISGVVKQLTGDDSLDQIFVQNMPSVKGEPTVVEPLVKLEQDYHSEEEDDDVKENFNQNHIDTKDFNALTPEEISEKRRLAHLKRVETLKNQPKETCDKCNKSFTFRAHFVSHLEFCNPEQIETLPPKNVKEPETEEEANRKREVSLMKRMQTLSKIKFEKCDLCGKEFKHRSNILNHLKLCNPEQIPRLPARAMKYKQKRKVQEILGNGLNVDAMTCNYCPKQFTLMKCLRKHEALHETDPENPNLAKGAKRKKFNPNPMPKGNYQCDRCSTSFRVYSALERHIEAHILSASIQNPDTDTDKGMGLKTIELKDGNIMRCAKCDLAYATHGMYRLHMQQYHEKALTCEECGKKFTLPNSLNKHRLNYHTSFPKTCDDCGQFCPTKQEFVVHLANVHGQGVQENNVPCEICGKLVKNKYVLKQHVKLVHERKGGEFPCDQCGKIMKSKASLEYHSKVHTGDYAFRCDECGNGYMRFDQMLDCKNTHAGIFKFHCTHCEYKSNKTKAFKNHITIHSSEKPFICPLCNHPSNTTTNLNNHIKKVHKITLCQAERLAKKTRFGHNMTEDDMEHNKTMLERGEKILETKKLRPENQKEEEASSDQQSLNLLGKIKEQPREALPGNSQDSQDSREQEARRFQPPQPHPAQNYPARPLFFPVHKYFGY